MRRDYADSRARLAGREVIILDGAIGTRLRRMEVPMSHDGWAGIALETHPFTVRRLHELYIEAGVSDCAAAHRNDSIETKLPPDEFLSRAQRWVSNGVQVIGGCGGVEIEPIRPLRDALPERLPG